MSRHGDNSLLRIDVLHAEKLLDLALDLTLSGGILGLRDGGDYRSDCAWS